MILRSLKMVKGYHRLRLLLKKQRLKKLNFIRGLEVNGFARIPDEFKLSNLSTAFQFYNPIPKLIEIYSGTISLRKIGPL